MLQEQSKSLFRTRSIPLDLRARFEDERLKTNISRMRGFSIYIIGLQILLNVINIVIPQSGVTENMPGMPIPLDYYIGLSLLTLAIGIVYLVLLTRARRDKIKSRAIKVFLVQSLIYLYAVIQLTFLTLNMLSNQGFGGFVVFILMFSMIPIVAPRQSIPTITVAFVYLIFLAVFTQGISGTAVSPYTGETYAWTVTTFSEFLYTDWRANLMIISVVSVFVSVVVYNLYVANFLKGEELEAQNTLLEQRVAERTLELAEKTEVAEGANRSKSRFMVAISHELRTPLNAILGMTHIAQNSDDPEKVERSLAQIESSSTLLLDLLSDVLDMSSIETGALRIDHKRFALKKVLAEVVASSEFIASQKAITLATNLDQVLEYTVFGDRLRLAQVLLNLLDNAIKFSAEDGEVELSVKVVEADEHNLEVFFAVTDRGIGMDEVRQSRLFKAFEQGTSDGMKHSGLGLGLSVSQSLVKMMGGTIAVLSEVDKGSTFSFSLNFDLADSTREGAIVIPRLTGKHILSVEDIAINRDILRELVEETDVIVEEAFDGREAVEKFAASPPGYYELIFMDLLMPHLDGFQATAQIRALARDDAPTVPIVALSANAYPEDIEKSLAAGMNSHIAKPLAFETLMVTLREYLG